MLAVKFELEPFDSLVALRIVANNAHFRVFSNVVLVALKKNFRNRLSGAESDKASNLVLESELKISHREDKRRSEHINESAPAERRDALFVVGPVAVVQRCELRLQKISDFQFGRLVVTR